jgi:hypothetical protein
MRPLLSTWTSSTVRSFTWKTLMSILSRGAMRYSATAGVRAAGRGGGTPAALVCGVTWADPLAAQAATTRHRTIAATRPESFSQLVVATDVSQSYARSNPSTGQAKPISNEGRDGPPQP